MERNSYEWLVPRASFPVSTNLLLTRLAATCHGAPLQPTLGAGEPWARRQHPP